MNFISTLWGLITFILAIVSFFPFLGWGNWLVIPLALVGVILSSLSSRKGGMTFNIIALILACFRLLMGGGVV